MKVVFGMIKSSRKAAKLAKEIDIIRNTPGVFAPLRENY
jgi:hypothetical protein